MGSEEPCDFCPMIKAIKNKKVESVELTAADGRNYELISAPLPNPDGTINSVAEIFLDITERKLAEQDLKESEEKFRNITEQSFMGIVILQDDVIKYVNKAVSDIYGYTIEEGLSWGSMEFMKLFTPDSREIIYEQIQKAETGDPTQLVHYVVQGIKKTGELIWVDNIYRTINYGGRPADLIVQIDITEKRNAEQDLKESQQMLQLVMDNIPEFIYWKDKDLKYLGCNENFARIAGVSKSEDIIGKTDGELTWKTEETEFIYETDTLVMEFDKPEYNIIETQLQADGNPEGSPPATVGAARRGGPAGPATQWVRGAVGFP